MPNPTSIAVLDATSASQTISTMDALLAVFGALADAAAANGASGTALAYLRAIKDSATSTASSPVTIDQTTQGTTNGVAALVRNPSRGVVPASATLQLMGSTGAAGDVLSHVLIIPSSTSPGTVTITDGAILAAPTLNAPSTATTGGTLAAATYYYKVTALGASGETLGSNEVSQATTGTTSTVSLSWNAITGATGYRVYRGTAAAGENVYYAPGNVTSYTDTGAANTGGSPPTTNSATSAAAITIFTGGSTSVSSLVPFPVPLGMVASTKWLISTGANVSAIGIGKFS